MQELAKERGGNCLSPEYINDRTQIKMAMLRVPVESRKALMQN